MCIFKQFIKLLWKNYFCVVSKLSWQTIPLVCLKCKNCTNWICQHHWIPHVYVYRCRWYQYPQMTQYPNPEHGELTPAMTLWFMGACLKNAKLWTIVGSVNCPKFRSFLDMLHEINEISYSCQQSSWLHTSVRRVARSPSRTRPPEARQRLELHWTSASPAIKYFW